MRLPGKAGTKHLVMKPAFLGLLFGIFLSLPGLLLRIAGALGAILFAVSLIVVDKSDLQSDLVYIGYTLVSVLAFASGTAMGALAEMLGAADRPYNATPPRMVATMIALRTLALLGGCAIIVGVAYLGRGMWLAALSACISGALLFVAGLALQNQGGATLPGNQKPDNN